MKKTLTEQINSAGKEHVSVVDKKLNRYLPKVVKRIEKHFVKNAKRGYGLWVSIGHTHHSWEWSLSPEIVIPKKMKTNDLKAKLIEHYAENKNIEIDEKDYWIMVRYNE